MAMLATAVSGPDAAFPLLIVHGLFGSARNWAGMARRLSDRARVIAVDLRNHGDSFHDPVHDYPAMAEDLARVIAEAGGQADVMGHSMGGKAAMVLALHHPERVRTLAVADIAPVSYAHTQLPLVEAMQAMDLTGIARRSEADRRLSGSVPSAALRAFLLQSLEAGPEGARWKLNLPALAANMPAIMGFPDIDGWFQGPVGFISGANSDYVRVEHQARIWALFPHHRHIQVPGAGHWLHADNPDGFEAALRRVLSSTG